MWLPALVPRLNARSLTDELVYVGYPQRVPGTWCIDVNQAVVRVARRRLWSGSSDFVSSAVARNLHPSSPVKDKYPTYVACDRHMLVVTQSVLYQVRYILRGRLYLPPSSARYVTPHSQPLNFHQSPFPAVHRTRSSRSPYMFLFLSPSRGL